MIHHTTFITCVCLGIENVIQRPKRPHWNRQPPTCNRWQHARSWMHSHVSHCCDATTLAVDIDIFEWRNTILATTHTLNISWYLCIYGWDLLTDAGFESAPPYALAGPGSPRPWNLATAARTTTSLRPLGSHTCAWCERNTPGSVSKCVLPWNAGFIS